MDILRTVRGILPWSMDSLSVPGYLRLQFVHPVIVMSKASERSRRAVTEGDRLPWRRHPPGGTRVFDALHKYAEGG